MNEDSFYTNLSGGTDFLLLEKKRKSEINVNTPVTSLRSVCVCAETKRVEKESETQKESLGH